MSTKTTKTHQRRGDPRHDTKGCKHADVKDKVHAMEGI